MKIKEIWNHRKRRFPIVSLALGTILTALFFIYPAYSFTDQTTTERKLKENKSFIDFLNICISNFAENKIPEFKEAYELHFNGYIAYLQANFKKSYTKIYNSQIKLDSLYSYIINDFYLEDSKDILDAFAPLVLKSKNPKARLYLTLGYRERAIGRNNFVSASASNPKLHSYRIFKYLDAVKKTRRAKRYGFLALFESQDNKKKREIYEHLFVAESKTGNPFFSRFLGKTGDSYITEMNSSYNQQNTVSEEKTEADQEKSDNRKEDQINYRYEKKVEKRVRFRYEKLAAEDLLFYRFDKANDIIVKYIDDFNFKLILSTILFLNTNKNPSDAISYDKFEIHHNDNYSRLLKNSALETFIDKINVIDEDKEKAETSEKPKQEEKAEKTQPDKQAAEESKSEK